MKYALVLALSALLTCTNAQLGPIPPERHPATSLREAVRQMRLSIDRELLYFARLQAQTENPSTTTRQTAADTILDEDDGFTEVVNDGKGIFRPILPGARVPAANEFADSTPLPSDPDEESPTPAVPDAPTVPLPPLDPSPSASPVVLPPVPPPDTIVTFTPTPSASLPATRTPVAFPPSPTDDQEDAFGFVSPSPTEDPSEGDLPPGRPGSNPSQSPSPVPEDAVIPPSPDDPLSPDNGANGDGPGETASAEDSGDDAVCFPAHATVQLEDGSVKSMALLQLGDRVRVAPNLFSDVFMFTHKLAHVSHRFVRIRTRSGHSLSLTNGHYLYVNGATAAASTVKPGDSVTLADATISTVIAVDSVVAKGLFNPQTVHGDIIVNGVRATTYTTAVERRLAHALLAPLRAAFVSVGWSLSVFDKGAHQLASLVPSGVLG